MVWAQESSACLSAVSALCHVLTVSKRKTTIQPSTTISSYRIKYWLSTIQILAGMCSGPFWNTTIIPHVADFLLLLKWKVNKPLLAWWKHWTTYCNTKHTKTTGTQGDTYHCLQSGGFAAGPIFLAWVSWDLWTEGLAIPGHFLYTCAWSALGWHFKLYHLSQERHWLLWRALLPAAASPSSTLHPSTCKTSHPSLEVVLGNRRRALSQWEAAAAGQPSSILSSGS